MSNRLSQLPVEALVAFDTTTVSLRVSQAPVEALTTFDVSTVPAQVSQLAIEVLHSPIDEVLTPNDAQLSQLPVEVLLESAAASEIAATQLVTELAAQGVGTLAVTQALLEIGWRAVPGSHARVTQLVIEIIKVPVAGTEVDPVTGLEPCALDRPSVGCWTPSTPSAACLDTTPDRASAGCWTAFTPAALRVGLLDSE